MVKWCFNYESGDYEYIEKDGFSIDRGEYVYNWDDSEYRREEDDERRNSLFNDGDDRFRLLKQIPAYTLIRIRAWDFPKS